MTNILDEFKERDILSDSTDKEKILSLKGKGAYIGFDPTAPSLHIGNYLQIISLLRFKKAGYKVYAVLGGATAMIGDPSGKALERKLLSADQIKDNSKKIIKQLEFFGIEVINNYNFYKDMNILDFLRDVGKLLNINYMINKDVVKSRLDKGISFTEFAYQLIQGWDFYKLYKEYDVAIQLGGSDQWGNITSGLEIIRKMESRDALVGGITTKLLTKSDGQKFGKTAEGDEILWIDENQTTSFKIYQYLLNQNDSDIKKLLNWMTFLSVEDIKNIMEKHLSKPYLKFAQKSLANEVLRDLRGQKSLDKALLASSILYDKANLDNMNDESLSILRNDINFIEIKDINIMDGLIQTSLAVSKREAKEFILNNAISLNGKTINDINYIIKPENCNKKYALLKRGKRNNALIIFI